MDQPEIPQTPESVQPFDIKNDLSPLEHAVISSSVQLSLDGSDVLLGEGQGALELADLVQNHPELLGRGVGQINGVKSEDATNGARGNEKVLERYIELFGLETVIKMMQGTLNGGLVLTDLDPNNPRVKVFLQENGVYVTDPGKPSEKYPFLDFAGVEDFTNLDGEVGKALVYKLKDNK